MSQEITLEIIFDAPVNRVWQAWTDPARMTWFGSDPGGRVISAEADARIGGRFRVKFRNSDETEYICQGTYREVERNARLAFTWEWENEPGTISFVTVSLAPTGDRTTRMRFSHADLWKGSAHDYEQGWTSTFLKLANSMTSK
jgi:uncharacterized protein YndB with AHSA1/START domain